MLKNGRLVCAIADAGFFEFRRQLECKAVVTGAQVVVIDRFYPDSKRYPGCGAIHAISLSERIIECGYGLRMGRDLNAAINIRRQALVQQSVMEGSGGCSATVKPVSVKSRKS